MPASKIVDRQEVLRWFEEGKTYQEMSRLYLEKYNIETVPSLWGNFRRREGLTRRITMNDELIPWLVREEHRYAYPLAMLRVEARRREGRPLRETDRERLDSWKEMLAEGNFVVHYDGDTEDGFFYIKREDGDGDLIHEPAKKTRVRLAAD